MKRNFEVFNENMSLKDAYEALYAHLQEQSYINVTDGKLEIYIDRNGDCSWYFTELVSLILLKASRADTDIVNHTIEQNIDLFDFGKPKLKTKS